MPEAFAFDIQDKIKQPNVEAPVEATKEDISETVRANQDQAKALIADAVNSTSDKKISTEDINDDNVMGAKQILGGRLKLSQAKSQVNPDEVPVAELKAAGQGKDEPVIESDDDKDDTQALIAKAILGLAPALVGAAVGGSQGGVAGARAGISGIQSLEQAEEKESKILSAKEKAALDASTKKQQAEEEHARDIKLKKLDFALKAGLKNMEKQNDAFKSLPEIDKIAAKDLIKDNTAKTAISNQLKADLGILNDPNVADDQRIARARGMIKTLNSTMGKDAVGVEEAKRLASFLNFNYFNLTEPGAFAGRDLDGFTDQVTNTIVAIDEAINLNQDQLAGMGLTSRLSQSPIPRGPERPKQSSGFIEEARAQADPNKKDPSQMSLQEKRAEARRLSRLGFL